MADCAACGMPLDPAARYCRHCGVGVAEAGRLRSYAQRGTEGPGAPPGRPAEVAPPTPPTRPLRRAGLIALAVLAVFAVGVATAAATAALARRHAQPTVVSGTAAPIGPTPTTGTPTPAGDIQLADSLHDAPHAPKVVALFRRYFESINHRKYDMWLGTLSQDRQPDSEEKFLEEYSTTVDDEIKIVGITPQEDGTLRVAVSFRSRQNPKYAPQDQPVDCLLWRIYYPLTFEDGQLKIALVEFGNREYRPCSD